MLLNQYQRYHYDYHMNTFYHTNWSHRHIDSRRSTIVITVNVIVADSVPTVASLAAKCYRILQNEQRLQYSPTKLVKFTSRQVTPCSRASWRMVGHLHLLHRSQVVFLLKKPSNNENACEGTVSSITISNSGSITTEIESILIFRSPCLLYFCLFPLVENLQEGFIFRMTLTLIVLHEGMEIFMTQWNSS